MEKNSVGRLYFTKWGGYAGTSGAEVCGVWKKR